MRVLQNLFGDQVTNLERALDRTTKRHGLLSNNLANVNVPNYKRQDIDFGIELQGKINAGFKASSQLKGAMNQEANSNRIDGNSVDLEKEVSCLAETELHYEALTQITSGYFSGLRNVIREGR